MYPSVSEIAFVSSGTKLTKRELTPSK
jgi:hypothetical protein